MEGGERGTRREGGSQEGGGDGGEGRVRGSVKRCWCEGRSGWPEVVTAGTANVQALGDETGEVAAWGWCRGGVRWGVGRRGL